MTSIPRALRPLLLLAAASIAGPAAAQQVQVDAALDHGVLRAETKQTAYLRLGLTGFRPGPGARRAAMNVAIVIDKSKSMAGDKIVQAKAAARAAIDHLGPDDIVSVVAYDSTVEVLVPATKARDHAAILHGVDRLRAGGMTALFGGTSKGAAEVRKFLAGNRVNRVILLSDGQANVGPSSPGDLARLGEQLARDGIGVTTVGLGLDFNEDLMVALAERSGGHHFFVEHARELAALFDEGFGGLASVVAKDVDIRVTFAEGVRPVRALGVDADIIEQTLRVSISQLYAAQTDEVVVELEIRPLPAARHTLAQVAVSYRNVATTAVDRIQTSVTARFGDDAAEIDASANPAVMISVAERLANLKSRLAVQLRDQGRTEEARRLLLGNSFFLVEQGERWRSKRLRELGSANKKDAAELEERQWNRRRKAMQERLNSPFQHDQVNF